jgi:crotonobetainyl-CoA hydratase
MTADRSSVLSEFAAIGQSADAMEGIVAFIERRAPSWTAG